MKKFLILTGVLTAILTGFYVYAQSSGIVVVQPSNASSGLAITNRAVIKQIVVSSSQNLLLELWDNYTNQPYWGTNRVNSAYVGVFSYPSNIVTTIISETGATNYWTNSTIFTYTNAVAAATNAQTQLYVIANGPNTVSTFNVDLIAVKGLCWRVNTNANIIISYSR